MTFHECKWGANKQMLQHNKAVQLRDLYNLNVSAAFETTSDCSERVVCRAEKSPAAVVQQHTSVLYSAGKFPTSHQCEHTLFHFMVFRARR